MRNLPGAADNLHALATELIAAHEAGWALVEPVHKGTCWLPGRHGANARSWRRRRSPQSSRPPPRSGGGHELVDEPPLPGDEVLRLMGTAAAKRTSVLTPTGRSLLRQVSGPPVSSTLLDEVTRQPWPTGNTSSNVRMFSDQRPVPTGNGPGATKLPAPASASH